MEEKKIVKVAVSGYFNPLHVGHLEMIEKAKELGAVDYMVKAQTMPDEVKSIIFKYLQV